MEVIITTTVNINILVTSSVNLTIVGEGTPVITDLLGEKAVQLNPDLNQKIDMSNLPQDSCLWNPEECKYGVTVTFNLKVR